jgi:hypothetical protein
MGADAISAEKDWLFMASRDTEGDQRVASDGDQDGGPLGTGALLSIGVGGMVGGGICAVMGLTINLTHDAAPIAFDVAGLVAILAAVSYVRLALRFPPVSVAPYEFLNRAFGSGMLTGDLSVLLCLSYVILLSRAQWSLVVDPPQPLGGAGPSGCGGHGDLSQWRGI